MRRAAFTLLEMIICVALIGLFTGALFAFYLDVARTSDRIVLAAGESADATLFFDRLEADLTCAIAGGGSLGAGLAGKGESITIITRSVALSAPVASDLQRCEYTFRGGVMRTTRTPLARTASSAAADETLAEGLDLVRFRYFDGRAWVEEFESEAAGALPVAVETAVWFASRGPARPDAEALPVAADDSGWTPEDQGGPEDSLSSGRLRQPDRLRVIIVPDGPVASWSSR